MSVFPNLPAGILREIIVERGTNVYKDYKLIKALLRDLCPDPDYLLEIDALIYVAQELTKVDLPGSLQNISPELLSDFIWRLCDNQGLPLEKAVWAVESWAWSLGREIRLAEGQYPTALHQTIIVSRQKGGHYRTITEAIEHAQPGAYIHVLPGHYQEGLVIDKSLTIIGEGPIETIIINSKDKACLSIQTDALVRLRRLTLRCGADSPTQKYYAVDIPRGQVEISDCDIVSQSSACIAVYGARTKATIHHCTIHDGRENGILVSESREVEATGCRIFGHMRAGVKVRLDGKLVLKNSTIRDRNLSGVTICERGEGELIDCVIAGNAFAGVQIRQSNASKIQGSDIRDTRGTGLLICENSRVTVEGCRIIDNAYLGVEIRDIPIQKIPGVIIRDCSIANNRLGAILLGEACQVKIVGYFR